MDPGELFRRWRRRRPDFSVMEAWMAGYASGCHNGFSKGHREGRQLSARERDVLLRELRCVFELVPSALREIRSRAGTDEREDDFLLMKLLSEAARLENGQSSADPEEAEARPERAEARSLGKVAAKPEQDEAGAPS